MDGSVGALWVVVIILGAIAFLDLLGVVELLGTEGPPGPQDPEGPQGSRGEKGDAGIGEPDYDSGWKGLTQGGALNLDHDLFSTNMLVYRFRKPDRLWDHG